MRILIAFLLLSSVAVAAEDHVIIVINQAGVWEVRFAPDGQPRGIPTRSKVLVGYDVIVHGVKHDPDNPDTPDPPPVDTTAVDMVAGISTRLLGDKKTATAAAAIVDALQQVNVSPENFAKALRMGAKIADTAIESGDTIERWAEECLAVSHSPTVIKAGVLKAFSIDQATLNQVYQAATDANAVQPEEAMDLATIIMLIKVIIDTLRTLGII